MMTLEEFLSYCPTPVDEMDADELQAYLHLYEIMVLGRATDEVMPPRDPVTGERWHYPLTHEQCGKINAHGVMMSNRSLHEGRQQSTPEQQARLRPYIERDRYFCAREGFFCDEAWQEIDEASWRATYGDPVEDAPGD